MILGFVSGAGAAAIIVIVITLFLIKKHDKKKDKLGGLQAGLSGADSCSKDYQDLCRARMAGKGAGNTESPGGRITSLAKEAERPPSSRSSTSSWLVFTGVLRVTFTNCSHLLSPCLQE